jgi:hypothetical protein
MINDNQLERMWKEAVMAQFKVLSWHLPGGIEENYKNLTQYSLSLGQDLNAGTAEYESEVLATQLQHSVQLHCEHAQKQLMNSRRN